MTTSFKSIIDAAKETHSAGQLIYGVTTGIVSLLAAAISGLRWYQGDTDTLVWLWGAYAIAVGAIVALFLALARSRAYIEGLRRQKEMADGDDPEIIVRRLAEGASRHLRDLKHLRDKYPDGEYNSETSDQLSRSREWIVAADEAVREKWGLPELEKFKAGEWNPRSFDGVVEALRKRADYANEYFKRNAPVLTMEYDQDGRQKGWKRIR